MSAWWRALAVAVFFSAWLGAQTTTSTITGTIRDKSGGVLGGVQVTVKHKETGQSRTGTSHADGRYIFAALAVGEYEIRAQMAGFRPLVHKGIHVTVAETALLDLELEVGAVDQEITVTGQASLVNTSSAELSYLVGEESIRELPLNGRNYTDLALLQPGVISYPHRDGGSVVAHGLALSINGQDPRSNVYLIDGTPQNDFTNGPAGSAAGTVLGVETIREFRVETNAYSAEFGRNFGGQISALSRSGANSLHGSLFEFLRNDNFDARNFFDRLSKPQFARNQFGAAAGGALRRDHTFFFFGYESLRERLGRTIATIVPDADARRGVFPDAANPGRTVTVPVSPAVRPYLDEFPVPNGGGRGGGLADYFFPFKQRTDQNFAQGRIDHNFSARQQVFVRYTFDGGEQRLPTDYPQFPRSFLSRNQFATAEYHQSLSPQTLNTFRAGFSRTRIGQDVEANTAQPLQPFIAGRTLVGSIDIGGLPRFGTQSSVNVKLVQNVFQFEDGLYLTRGRHLLKLGALAERYRDNMFNPTFGLGIFTFADVREFVQNRAQRFVGLPPNGALDRYWRFTLFGFYLQDDLRVNSRLTLNLGVRYEFSTQPRDIYGRDSALLRMTDPAPVTGQLYRNPTRKNLAPRFGFSWDPFGNAKTVLRGGYGLFFNTNNQQNLIVTVTNPPATPRVIVNNPVFPVPSFAGGIGNSIRPVEWNLKNPYVQVWNLNVQREIFPSTVVTAGYAGSRGLHLLRSGDWNIAVPQQRPDGSLFFPVGAPRMNPAFSTIEIKKSDGNSWYNALIFEVRRRWSKGLNFQSSYTFARNIDTTQASTFFSDATNGTTSAFPEFPGFNYNKGLADYHAKHNWVFNLTYELPFAKNHLWGGWQVSTITSARSGNPLTLFVSRNRSRSQWGPSLGPGLGQDRPSMAPGFTHQSAVLGGPDRYFNPAAFALQPAGFLGNLGRGALIGPDLRAVDLSLVKNTKWARLGESGDIQFRVEAFNLFNHANFGPPNLQAFAGAVDNEAPLPSLGAVRNTVTFSRQVQLGLRIRF
ncbi:MAG: TonB-dependent receptor [Acidobacteria bacterium]|nr:TonB-dependent receptor [Acidobacteriota bacterium]